MVHANSIDCYHQERGRLSERASAVLKWISEHGPATDREVMRGLGFMEPNSVRPRITELVDLGLLIETGSERCIVTGKRVRKVDVQREAQGRLFG